MADIGTNSVTTITIILTCQQQQRCSLSIPNEPHKKEGHAHVLEAAQLGSGACS
jgi:hypothetical protein